jgi:hypothetical protein
LSSTLIAMSDNTSTHLSVFELTEDNFITWRPCIQACLAQRGLLRVVHGNLLPPTAPLLLLPQGTATTLTNTESIANAQAEQDYKQHLELWLDKDKKACSNILAHISTTQCVHIEGETSAYAMWQALLKIHMQQVPGTCFSAYNKLFSIVKRPKDTLPAVAARVKAAIACIKELCPATVTVAGASVAYTIKHLDDKLALMAMLCALPRNKYGDFILLLMRTPDLTHCTVEAAFQVKQTKRSAHHGPLVTPAGNVALCMRQDICNALRTPSSIECTFCEAAGHTQDQCFACKHAADTAKAKTKERKEEHKAKHHGGGNCAVAATASLLLSSAAPKAPAVKELAASASLCLAGTHNTHADAHWIADLGATSHMSTQRHWFKTLEPHIVPIRIANNAIVYSKGIGPVVLEPLDKLLDPLLLSCVLYIPALQNNLLSVLHLVSTHCFRVEIEGQEMLFLRDTRPMFTVTIRKNTAWLDVHTLRAPKSVLCSKSILDCSLWHCCLGHIGKDALEKAIWLKLGNRLLIDSNALLLLHCKPCIVGKHHRNLFPAKALHCAMRILQRIHSDMHMVPVATSSGYCYWVTFINDWSRYSWIYLLKRKSNVFEAFKAVKVFVKLQFGALIKCLHDNKGSKYIGHLWDAFFAQTGIQRKHTVEGMLQQGGIAERCNCTLKEHVVAMLNGARLPICFWGKALYMYGCLLNMTPLSAIPPDMTPYKMAHKRKPDYSTLRIFGCRTWAHVCCKKRKSLEPHAKPCMFLGVPDNFKGWKLWDLSAQGGHGAVIILRNVIWNEEEFPGLLKDAHNQIPAHFSCINTGTPAAAKPSMPASEESAEDSDEQEGGTLPLPALVPLDDNSTDEPPLPTLSSLSSDTLLPLPPALHTQPRRATALQMPDTPQPPQHQSVPRLACQRMPELLPLLETLPAPAHCSGRSTAGVPPNPRLSATQYLQEGCPAPVCVATYSKVHSHLQSAVPPSAPTSRKPTPAASGPAAPSIVEEEADTPAPGPSQTANASYNKFDFLTPNAACLVQRWMGKRALLAQGLEAIYSDSDKFIPYHNALKHTFVAGTDASKPKSFWEAMQRPDANLWYKAAVKEMQAHIKNGTWELVKLLPGRKAIGSKWVFKVKHNTNGSIKRYKARLVAQGFSQRPSIDFDKTFAPTAKWAALHTIFALAALEDWELELIDISNAYLNSKLRNVEVYMRQPKGFDNCNSTWVARLLKGLYGLKQGGCKWFKRLEEVLSQLGFSCICADGLIFIWANNNMRMICPVFVDNITFASKSKAKIAELKAAIAQHFKLRNLGPTTFQLGIEITRKCSQRTLHLSQRRYTQDLLEHYGFANSSPVLMPMDSSVSLTSAHVPSTPEDKAFMRTVPYVSTVGALMYLAIATHPDIVFAMGVLCRFMACPGPEHWKAVKHLFRYLHSTIDYWLMYTPNAFALKPFYAYSNADHSGNCDNSCSTSAYVVKIGSGVVLWMSCLQPIVALSTTEAEFIAAASAGQEVIWMCQLLGELSFLIAGPLLLLLDNQSAIQVGKNPEHHGRMKHLNLRFFWLRDVVTAGQIALRYVPTADMGADLLTKGLARIKVAAAIVQLGLTAP